MVTNALTTWLNNWKTPDYEAKDNSRECFFAFNHLICEPLLFTSRRVQKELLGGMKLQIRKENGTWCCEINKWTLTQRQRPNHRPMNAKRMRGNPAPASRQRGKTRKDMWAFRDQPCRVQGVGHDTNVCTQVFASTYTSERSAIGRSWDEGCERVWVAVVGSGQKAVSIVS